MHRKEAVEVGRQTGPCDRVESATRSNDVHCPVLVNILRKSLLLMLILIDCIATQHAAPVFSMSVDKVIDGGVSHVSTEQ